MKTTKTVVTVKKGSSSRSGAGANAGISSGNKQVPTIITREISSGQSGLRHSLRGSGKVWKKTVLGKKFEFAEKLKEKKIISCIVLVWVMKKMLLKKLSKFLNQKKKK